MKPGLFIYWCKTWTLTEKPRKNAEAEEMWFYRRILRIPCTALQTNQAVLQKIGQERKLLCCVEQRQLKFLGHAIRKGEHEDLALNDRICGKSARITQRFTFINNFKHLYQNPGQLCDAARNRTNCKSMIMHPGLEQS